MPTTTNFGWTTPADTDLVKDGALAIRTLGNGIDTSFLDLKGGTTDQVLAKNSNTDLDFKWVNASAVPTNDYNYVSTNQTTTSTSYTDLATTQSVTMTTGTKALIIVGFLGYNSSAGETNFMSYAVSGATTISAANAYAAVSAGTNNFGISKASVVTLTAGSNTFTAKFKVGAGTGNFSERYLIVVNLA
jgi:hypothetical protein